MVADLACLVLPQNQSSITYLHCETYNLGGTQINAPSATHRKSGTSSGNRRHCCTEGRQRAQSHP